MPRIEKQKELSCGYWCERAMLDHWYMRLTGTNYQSINLTKTTVWSYDPGTGHPKDSGQNELIQKRDVPTNMSGWARLVEDKGPLIANGKLGGGDWTLRIKGHKLFRPGIGHYVLIVGYNRDGTGELAYKDPLYSNNEITWEPYLDLESRFFHGEHEKVYCIKGEPEARTLLQLLDARPSLGPTDRRR